MDVLCWRKADRSRGVALRGLAGKEPPFWEQSHCGICTILET